MNRICGSTFFAMRVTMRVAIKESGICRIRATYIVGQLMVLFIVQVNPDKVEIVEELEQNNEPPIHDLFSGQKNK